MGIIKEMLIEPFTEKEFVGYLVGILMWTLFLLVLSVLLMGLYFGVDSFFTEKYNDKGVVIEKSYSPPYNTTQMILVGKVMIPQTIHHPAKWNLEVEIKDGLGVVSIKKLDWERISIGQNVNVVYSQGRISNDIYIKELIK